MSHILAIENKLQRKEDTINENERELSFNSHFVYECRTDSFNYTNKKILKWKSTGVFNYPDDDSMKGTEDTKTNLPELKNDRKIYVYLQGNYFKQNNLVYTNNNKAVIIGVINIYIVYKLGPIASSRDTTFTIQNALFGAMEITKNADTSKYDYKGYGICFDERSEFGHRITEGGFAHTTDARNVLIFGADMSFSVHKTNRANHIYLMGTGLTQGIHDTTIYAEKNFYRNFTDPGKKFCIKFAL